MSNEEFTLKEMLVEMRVDMKEMSERMIRHEEVGIKTLEQATKTNGRVSKSEADIILLKDEQGRFKTIVATLASVGAIIWTGFTFIFK